MSTRQYNKRKKATKRAISDAIELLNEFCDIDEGDIISGFRVVSLTYQSGNFGTWCRCEMSRHGETIEGESCLVVGPDSDDMQYIRVDAVLASLAYHDMQLDL